MDDTFLQLLTAIGAIGAAFFTGLIELTSKRRDRQIEKMENNMAPFIDDQFNRIGDKLERGLDKLDRIADTLRDMS